MKLTLEEISYLRYALSAVKLSPADKESTTPEEYARSVRLHRALIKKLDKAARS